MSEKKSIDFINKYFYPSYIVIINMFVDISYTICFFFFFGKWEKEEVN